MNNQPELLSTIVLYTCGALQRVRRYYRGVYPALGRIHRGLTGLETVQEADVIRPSRTFLVRES